MSSAGVTARPPLGARLLDHVRLPGRRFLRLLAALVVLAALLACCYLLWLRDSSLVRVERVSVTGLTTQDAGRARSALAGAARQMTTLHVDRAKLERAAAAFPVIRSIEVGPDFPHGMRIHVIEERPAAMLVSGRHRVPVAGDGSVLSGLPVRVPLPVVRIPGSLPVGRMHAGAELASVRVAAGRPAALASRIREVRRERGKGLVVPVEDGPRIVFGDATRVAAKWAAATRVLADLESGGADYIDVRLPERPVAGGLRVSTLAPVAPADPTSPASEAPPAATPQGDRAVPAPTEPQGTSRMPAAAAPGASAPPAAPVQPAAPQAGQGGGAAVPQP